MARTGLRLDIALVERGIVESRSKAQAMILAGDVLVDGVEVPRAGHQVREEQSIELRARKRFVSRGGDKLRQALGCFSIDVEDRVCADIGASTGGFTDCLLQAGASRVYAIDVGYGQLDFRLRNDSRIVVMERVNARYLESLPETVDLVTIDVSFISLKLIFPVAVKLLGEQGACIALVKPQFEAGRDEVGKKGVVSKPDVHEKVLQNVMTFALENSFSIGGLIPSPLLGPEGNVEFLLYLRTSDDEIQQALDMQTLIDIALGTAHG